MKFNDKGIIISSRKYGENSLLLKIFSQNHGIISTFVKSVKSSKNKVIYQIGNLISFEYRAKSEENLGQIYYVDLIKSYLSLVIFDRLKIDCASSLFSIVSELFLDGENCHCLFEKINLFLQKINDEKISKNEILSNYVKIELKILKTLGYEVDLSSCAATETSENLVFVSPKSARAVCFEAGKKYENKLLKLPKFLIDENSNFGESCLFDGLKLSGFFLDKFLFSQKEYANQNHLFYRKNIEKNL